MSGMWSSISRLVGVLLRSSLGFEVLEIPDVSLGVVEFRMELEAGLRLEEEIAFLVCRKSSILQCIILLRTTPWGSTRINCLLRTEIGL